MPYKSRSQQRLFHHLVSQGKLAPEVVEEFDDASKGKRLPQHVKRKAFGGQIEAESGTHCPACDYPLDSVPVAMDAGEGCPRCGYGDAKDVPQKKAHGGEIQGYAKGGDVKCAACGSTDIVSLHGDMKELYLSKKDAGASLDDGKIRPFGSFAKAIKHRR